MNKQRRKQLREIADKLADLNADLESLKDEEQEAYDNLPESLQDGERGQTMNEIIDTLDTAFYSLEETICSITEAIEH
ncbi:MAG: hypothetical protein AAGU19_08050 [Prolixibacteraceae bacterium]